MNIAQEHAFVAGESVSIRPIHPADSLEVA